ncbi:hypothetical protein LJC07_00810 [Christensenellaceae bacterium OttesenSCG-928-L17]|nr:hypothetical protein [Christensenellaceae bacterium OttesenSCG-928-L17]
MKKVKIALSMLLCLAMLAGILPQAQVAYAATGGTVQASGEGVLNANRVNIRPGPSTKNAALGKAGKGDRFRVTGFTIPIGFSQGFFQVEGGSIPGSAYIAGNYLNVTFTAPLNGKITKKGYLYTAKSTSRKYRAGSIAVGDALPLLAREGKWWRTEVNGQTLWAPIANVLQVQGATTPTAAASGIQLTPSTTKPTYGSVQVSVSGVEGAGFVGWRRHTTGATYTSKSGFRDITAAKHFPASSNGWYAVGVVDAQGQFHYELIHITNIMDYSSHDSSGGSATTQKTNITFTAEQAGGVSSTTDSTGITLTFSQAVTGLSAGDISISNGTGAVVKGTLSGSGMVWTIALADVTAQGSVDVSIADFGTFHVTNNPRTVTVYRGPRTYTLSVSNLSTQGARYGSVAITTGAATGNAEGASVTVTATPAQDHVFVGWVATDSRTATLVSTNTAYTFNINANTTLYAIFSGDGVNVPKEIATKDELADIANDLTKSYKLLNDIDVGSDWKPIGDGQGMTSSADTTGTFTGTLDGNGHTISISGVSDSINTGSNGYGVGVFGWIGATGSVKNLHVTGTISYTSPDANETYNVGGIAGSVYSGSIENCISDVTITVSGDANIVKAGGIAGVLNAGSSVSNCLTTGDIAINTTTPGLLDSSGGVVGSLSTLDAFSTINNCVALNGIVKVRTEGAYSRVTGANQLGTVSNCYASTAMRDGAGGIAWKGLGANHAGTDCTPPLDANWWSTNMAAWGWGSVWQLPASAGELPTLRTN